MINLLPLTRWAVRASDVSADSKKHSRVQYLLLFNIFCEALPAPAVGNKIECLLYFQGAVRPFER